MAGATPADLPNHNLMKGTDLIPYKKFVDVKGIQGTQRRGIRLSNPCIDGRYGNHQIKVVMPAMNYHNGQDITSIIAEGLTDTLRARENLEDDLSSAPRGLCFGSAPAPIELSTLEVILSHMF